jgi:hypothetical protein
VSKDKLEFSGGFLSIKIQLSDFSYKQISLCLTSIDSFFLHNESADTGRSMATIEGCTGSAYEQGCSGHFHHRACKQGIS